MIDSLLLNKPGRLSLIKHTLTSLLVYHMSSLKFPSSATHKKKSPPFSQISFGVAQPTRNPSTGKIVHVFNQALLAKQSWRILDHPNCLFSSFFPSKFCHSTPFLEVKPSASSSEAWRSILHGKDVLVKGIRWQIGSGDKISIWNDYWLPSPLPIKLHSCLFDDTPLSTFLSLKNATVDKLFMPSTKEWNKNLIVSLFPA